MGFKQWLWNRMIVDGVITEEQFSLEDMDYDVLISSTDMDETMCDNYCTHYSEYCQDVGEEPVWDLPNMEF